MGMSETLVVSKAMKAGGVIGKYNIVKFGVDDEHVIEAAAAGDSALGVAQNAAVAEEDAVRVMVIGISRVKLGGTVTRGDFLTSDANGEGVAATRHAHTENTAGTYTQNATTAAAAASNVIGRALKSGVAGDIVPIVLMPAAV